MLSRCTGQVDVGVHITVFGMAEINKAGEGHHEARAERFALECDPAQFLGGERSEEHTSELQSLMRISYAVFCLKKKKEKNEKTHVSTQLTQYQLVEPKVH